VRVLHADLVRAERVRRAAAAGRRADVAGIVTLPRRRDRDRARVRAGDRP